MTNSPDLNIFNHKLCVLLDILNFIKSTTENYSSDKNPSYLKKKFEKASCNFWFSQLDMSIVKNLAKNLAIGSGWGARRCLCGYRPSGGNN